MIGHYKYVTPDKSMKMLRAVYATRTLNGQFQILVMRYGQKEWLDADEKKFKRL